MPFVDEPAVVQLVQAPPPDPHEVAPVPA